MSSAAILFSNIHDRDIPELTMNRSAGAIPFAGRYRLVDFALSNLVNSNIYDVNMVAHYNYSSLMEHIGSGKEWDLARSTGGLKLLPPFMRADSSMREVLYTTRLEALKSIVDTINAITEDYIIMSDSNIICNIDLNDVIKQHKSTGADMTAVIKTVNMTRDNVNNDIIIKSDENGKIIDVKRNTPDLEGVSQVYMNICVFNRTYLQNIINDAIAHNYHSMTFDVIRRNMKNSDFRVYDYKNFIMSIVSLKDYYNSSMEILTNPDVRNELFRNKLRPIITRIRNSVPTYYGENSNVKNSLIADGCNIHGTVENSIIFRGVTIGRGAVVRDSVIFKNVIIGKNAFINCCLSDINATVSDNMILSGCKESPYYIGKNKRL